MPIGWEHVRVLSEGLQLLMGDDMIISAIPLSTPFLYKVKTDCNQSINEAVKLCYSKTGKSVYVRIIHPVAYGDKSYISFTWFDVAYLDEKWAFVDCIG
jgi:hypothetical protein